jgi:hypothetical protein
VEKAVFARRVSNISQPTTEILAGGRCDSGRRDTWLGAATRLSGLLVDAQRFSRDNNRTTHRTLNDPSLTRFRCEFQYPR